MSENFFILLPFFQYPDEVPRNVRDPVEKASILLYILDELRKPTLLHRKGENLTSFVKFLHPYRFYRQGMKLFIAPSYNNVISPVKFRFPKHPSYIEDFNENSLQEFQKQLNGMVTIVNELQEEEIILEHFLPHKSIVELENLLFSQDSKLVHIRDLPSYKPMFENQDYQTVFKDMIKVFEQLKNNLNEITQYLYQYPEKVLQKTLNVHTTKFNEQKAMITEEYKDIIEKITQEVNREINTLEKISYQKKSENRKKYFEILKTFIQNQPELLKAKFSQEFANWPIYTDSPENLMQDLNQKFIALQKNYDELVLQYKKIESDFSKIKNEELESLYAIDEEFLKKKNEQLLRIKNLENERDKQVEEIDSLQRKLKSQTANIINLIKEKQIYVENKMLELQQLVINIVGLEFADQIAENITQFLMVPYYIISIEDPLNLIQRTVILPPLKFSKTNISTSMNLSIYGSNTDPKYVHIWFNGISEDLLSSVKMFQQKKQNKMLIQQLTNDLKERNFLLDSQVEADIYNGLEYLYNNTGSFRLNQLNDLKKIHLKVIEMFNHLHKLILDQTKYKKG